MRTGGTASDADRHLVAHRGSAGPVSRAHSSLRGSASGKGESLRKADVAHPNSQVRPASRIREEWQRVPSSGWRSAQVLTLTLLNEVKNEAEPSEVFTSPFFNDNKKRKESWAMSTSLCTRRFGSPPPPRLFSITAILLISTYFLLHPCPAVKTSDFNNPAKLCDLLAPTAALFL